MYDVAYRGGKLKLVVVKKKIRRNGEEIIIQKQLHTFYFIYVYFDS